MYSFKTIYLYQNGRHDDGNASKDELRRERRERLVKKGVQEKGKLKEMYTGRKQELEQAQVKLIRHLDTNAEKINKSVIEAILV